MSDYADALARRNGAMALPAPDGIDDYGPGAWWRLSSGGLLFATPGQVHDHVPGHARDLNQMEMDALAELAAVRWARNPPQRYQPAPTDPINTEMRR